MSSIFPQETATQTSTSPADDVAEKIEVNLDEEVEADDPEGDFNERVAPPLASKLQAVKWSLAEKGVVPGVDKNKKSFLGAHLVAELIGDESVEGFKTNYYVNSIIFRGKTTSELHHFMNSIGEPLPKMKLSEMKERIETALAKNPLGYVETEWKAGYQGTDVDPKTQKPKWVDQYIRMEQFPLVDDPDNPGKKIRSHIAKSKKDGEDIFAQLYIKQILSPGEVKKRQG